MIGETTSPESTRAWQEVLTHIENDLLSGALGPGDHLPSERTLAAELGVGRSSVREALRVLEVLGLLRTQTGSGPGSGAIIIARPSGGMSSLIRLQVAAQGFRVDDVVATRLILETAVAAQLAASASANAASSTTASAETTATPCPDLSPATEILDAMEATGAAEPTPGEFLALDAQFHYSLAEIAGNEVIAAMMTGLRNSIESYALGGVPNLTSWRTTSDRLRREHRAIVAAIECGDPVAASQTVNDHITQYYAEAGFGTPATSTLPKGPHHG
ncbi:GntR family transcriptional regulator [Subtercola boreus]|uniref:GntR family transcriptional regulator n=1 Tax=Subtercola boreus TaxID=120213 RepID=A0A3E0W5U3_9MICO|nr:FCD domain-containing protein [Subtercola boreus]RFA17119.1 GntR family transcriptional regulator [Subtercola boreus]